MSDKQWYTTLNAPMTNPQKRALLKKLQDPTVLSSLRRPEILMDFLTDCVSSTPPNLSLAVPALQGLYTLIITRNLDYPLFYPRLYSLLDNNLLHSKHRSRLLRHLDGFLAPTNHIPAATIASFVKRLSRLSLFAPPAAIIAIVPFIYNLLKAHPTCTFMLHRQPYPPYTKTTRNLGTDPYNPAEIDPQQSGAIDSSLWELHTLQDHYNPTVSSICRIISEQFTKQQYNLEDFLDHGYGTLLGSELGKDGRREPVVEWRIPGRVFGREGVEGDGDVLLDLWEFY
ncbi:Maturation and nuclear export of 40S ribosomal subunits interacting protein [Knufia obscura]|uniref:Maturation and nuclear export of 40S ribosomal subunits interacting protein n=1 Tax=Knufia obscura TaxID=1635080 RepID=A0ABR0RV66_9EURO|nr:Maturation and nuclear export of 40S ribosomal subunits interacting protein [Knufia obscura]